SFTPSTAATPESASPAEVVPQPPSGTPLATAPSVTGPTASMVGQVPLSFEANLGQTDPSVQFLSRGSGSTLFLTPTAAVLSLQKTAGVGTPGQGAALFMRFVGANPAPRVFGQDELPGKVNDFTGGDLARAHTDIPTFARVEYQDVYAGIDLTYYG